MSIPSQDSVSACSRRPDFVGIGVQKAGTSWLYECLLDHPRIWGPPKKELRYFDNEKNYDKGANWYQQWFANAPTLAVIGEFTPGYCAHPAAAERMDAFFDDVRLLVSLRDPVDRLLSQVRHYIRNGNIQTEPRAGKVDLRLDMINERIAIRSRYTESLQPFFERFPREKIKIIFFEDLKSEPVSVTQDVYHFLGVNRNLEPTTATKKVGGSYIPRSKTLEALKQWVSRISNHQPLLGQLVDRLRRSRLSRFYKNLNGKALQLNTTDAQRAKLEEEFADEYSNLEDLIGEPTPWTPAHI
jgi:hypothetical protein